MLIVDSRLTHSRVLQLWKTRLAVRPARVDDSSDQFAVLLMVFNEGGFIAHHSISYLGFKPPAYLMKVPTVILFLTGLRQSELVDEHVCVCRADRYCK